MQTYEACIFELESGVTSRKPWKNEKLPDMFCFSDKQNNLVIVIG